MQRDLFCGELTVTRRVPLPCQVRAAGRQGAPVGHRFGTRHPLPDHGHPVRAERYQLAGIHPLAQPFPVTLDEACSGRGGPLIEVERLAVFPDRLVVLARQVGAADQPKPLAAQMVLDLVLVGVIRDLAKPPVERRAVG